MKICTKCNTSKLLKEFTISTRLPDGHTTQCKVCTCARQSAWREYNRDKTRAAVRRYAAAHPERVKAQTKIYQKTLAYKHITKMHNAKQTASGFKRAWLAGHRARKLSATPPWADYDKIKDIYMHCPEGHHVDHVIPLKGKNVCGLHVETNLQYLTAKENIRKSNKLLKEYA